MQKQHIKLVVVGDGAVGKTSLLMCRANNGMVPAELPTVFDNYSFDLEMSRRPGKKSSSTSPSFFAMGLWDTAGSADYDKLRPLSYPRTDVFLCCFSVVSPPSFEAVQQKWVPELRHHCPNVPILLVGTKSDLRQDEDAISKLKEKRLNPIETKQANECVRELGLCGYIEVSVVSLSNIQEVFEEAVLAVITPRNTSDTKETRCIIS